MATTMPVAELRLMLDQDIEELATIGRAVFDRGWTLLLTPATLAILADDAGVSRRTRRSLYAPHAAESSPAASRAVLAMQEQVANASTPQIRQYAGLR